MAIIPVGTYRISGNNFKRYYLKNKSIFSIFYCISEICMKLEHFEKKKMSILA